MKSLQQLLRAAFRTHANRRAILDPASGSAMTYEELCRDYDRIHDIYYPRLKNKLERDSQDINKIKLEDIL